ncbi:MAG: M48 family metalloprotease [Desulfovibrionales bacterium]
MNSVARISGTLVILFSLVWFTPAQGGILGDFSIKDEVELGRKFNILIRSQFPLVEDPEVTDYIQDMVDRLEAAMPPQPFPIRISVVRNNSMNAFAAPGGYLFIFTGMILGIEDESELAGVLAHELAHVSQRHIAKQMERSQLINIGSLLGMLASAMVGEKEASTAVLFGTLAGTQSAHLKYSREDEREADQVGMNFLVNAGYRPAGMPESFEKIRKVKWLSGGSLPAYLSTHPATEERIDYLRERIKKLPPEILAREDDPSRLQRIQTLLRARYTGADEALAHFTQAKEDCYNTLGESIVLSRLNRMQEAEKKFSKALSCSEKDSLFVREAGRFFFSMGEFSRAEPLLNEAVLRNPRDLMALFFYARLLNETGRISEAISYMERILRHLPEDSEVHYYMGRMQGEKGDTFLAHVHLAYSFLYRNNREKTLFHMDRARQLAGKKGSPEVLERLERIYEERSEFWAEK